MINLANFYPAIIGGTLIAISCILLMLALGRITGISGIFFSAIQNTAILKKDQFWQVAFITGLIIGGALAYNKLGFAFSIRTHFSIWEIIMAGLLVGYGTQLGNGCTSGHGICGISRFSIRSIVATLIFMSSAIATVYLTHHIL